MHEFVENPRAGVQYLQSGGERHLVQRPPRIAEDLGVCGTLCVGAGPSDLRDGDNRGEPQGYSEGGVTPVLCVLATLCQSLHSGPLVRRWQLMWGWYGPSGHASLVS